jgi:ABC-type lipopolysaccharide export system ATPase subunit
MLTQSLNQLLLDHPMQAAPVSVDVPLISNQEVYMNIALIKQYHENMPKKQAQRLAVEYLQRVGLEHIAYKRNPALNQEERFCVMLLRAAMVRDAMIVIDQPFKIIPHLKDIQYIMNALKKIDDLYLSCHIYDYKWMEEKYGEL